MPDHADIYDERTFVISELDNPQILSDLKNN
jgi:hypothetical protein